MQNFTVYKFYSYSGPNIYLDRQAMVFNVYLTGDCPLPAFFRTNICTRFPELGKDFPDTTIELFARTLSYVFRMDMNLFIRRYTISKDDEEYVVAIEHIDDTLAKEAVKLVSRWFIAISENDEGFDFEREYHNLQQLFNDTLFGGPTVYSLIEGAIKRKINIHWLEAERQLQWGYGRKQLRGFSTVFHTDSIKDVEFTSFKDRVNEFLETFGFPSPRCLNCFDEDEAVDSAFELGFPLVAKPASSYDGSGITMSIRSEPEVRSAFRHIVNLARDDGYAFSGVILQKQVEGYDHRVITVGGKYIACLKRTPPSVLGDGKQTLAELIYQENNTPGRTDNVRSPLAKIPIDMELISFLKGQGISIDTVAAAGQRIFLRNTASVSLGGVSENVSSTLHPDNVELVERVARFLNICCLGIDVLTDDISVSWKESKLWIIGVNSGPGVFMHQVPAIGKAVDVPGKILEHFFGRKAGYDRIPIIAGNQLSDPLISKIFHLFAEYKPGMEFGSLHHSGVYFNGRFFSRNERHDINCQIILRNPQLDVAVFNHKRDDILDYGLWHQGLDIAVLINPCDAEQILKRDLLPGGLLVEVFQLENMKYKASLYQNAELLKEEILVAESTIDNWIFSAIKPYLRQIFFKYD